MSEDNKSELRKDLSPSEFEAKMDNVAPKGQKTWEKVKGFFGNLLDALSSLGFLPVFTSGSSKTRGHHGHAGGEVNYQASSNFRESQRVNTPPTRTHEQWLIDQMAHEAYYKMVDGKGDHDCDHEH